MDRHLFRVTTLGITVAMGWLVYECYPRDHADVLVDSPEVLAAELCALTATPSEDRAEALIYDSQLESVWCKMARPFTGGQRDQLQARVRGGLGECASLQGSSCEVISARERHPERYSDECLKAVTSSGYDIIFADRLAVMHLDRVIAGPREDGGVGYALKGGLTCADP